MKNSVLLSILSFLSLAISAQTVDCVTNIPHSGDMLTRIPIPYFTAGGDGADVIWDFSSFSDESDSCENIEVEYFIDPDSSRLCVAAYDALLRLSLTDDTLFVICRETSKERLYYDVPMIKQTYPFEYGDVISSTYLGHGTYCSRLNTRVSGTVRIESDAEGIIVTESCDTLYNVLRIHTVRTGSTGMYSISDQEFSDTTHVKQEIEERNEWYVRGYRYPLYETTTVTYYDDMTQVSCMRSASRIDIENMLLNDDSVNDSILAADVVARNTAIGGPDCSLIPNEAPIPTTNDIIHYTTKMNGTTLLLEYSLESDANLTFIVCNKMGMLFISRKEQSKADSNLCMEFDCSGLVPNDYILYINVNGAIYSITFKIN